MYKTSAPPGNEGSGEGGSSWAASAGDQNTAEVPLRKAPNPQNGYPKSLLGEAEKMWLLLGRYG